MVGHVWWMSLQSGALRQNPPPIAAPHHSLVLVLPPVRRNAVLTPEKVTALVHKRYVTLRHQAEPLLLPMVAINEVQMNLQVMRTHQIHVPLHERTLSVIQRNLRPHVRIAPRKRQRILYVLLKQKLLVRYYPRHGGYHIVHVHHSQNLHPELLTPFFKLQIPNPRPRKRKHRHGNTFATVANHV
ncbi:hypothetical protein V8G54_022509 [Vigna mungo]|uniref:Uncharacterized protein n=1 Tax=Vigna mungo TaxID=3915 RepID=A0AAQ3N227_VIGMU